MRWSIVRLIAARETSDLLRDRRTLFLVFGLPVLLYPLFALIIIIFAKSMLATPLILGLVGREYLPSTSDYTPETLVGGGLVAGHRQLVEYPPLVLEGAFVYQTATDIEAGGALRVIDLPKVDKTPLENREVDLILEIPKGFSQDLKEGKKPTLTIHAREGEDTSKQALRRLNQILDDWLERVKEARFARAGLPLDFDEVVDVHDPIRDKEPLKRTLDELRDTLVKMLPFLVIMWAMAGALHPAIDMTAGEKERGTMETLLISPAERLEIVSGKFMATLGFSYFTALWNILWMGGGALVLGLLVNEIIPMGDIISFTGLAWACMFALPLSALFSAVALALGLYARGTKEGQYYLIPLFLFTMPLTFWSMAPGIELNWQMSLVPVTGLALLLQQLMSVSPAPGVFWYFIPVLGGLFLCVAISLWWAVRQFHNESVLFRESEQDLFAWVKQKWRRKE